MTLPEDRFSSTDWNSIERQLDRWFAEQHSRNSLLPFRSSDISEGLALRACQLFKRGGLGLADSDTGSEMRLPLRSREFTTTSGTSYGSWESFFKFRIDPQVGTEKFSVIVDQTVADLHVTIETTCSASRVQLIRLEASEERKNLQSVRDLYEKIHPETETLIIVGGGICCDISALVGGLLNLNMILVPTTLLALIDAGLGGKTGVNHPRAGKNQIGLFANISEVVSVQDLLTTLPRPRIDDGIGEIMKHAWLAGKFSRWQPAILKLLNKPAGEAMMDPHVRMLIQENIEFKKTIVAADPFEDDIRVLLNLGHTVAHLIEGLSRSDTAQRNTQRRVSHGIAVALGLSSLISSKLLSDVPEGFTDVLDSLKERAGIVFPMFDLKKQYNSMNALLQQDKKNLAARGFKSSDVRCVLPPYGILRKIPADADVPSFLKTCIKVMPIEVFLKHLQKSGMIQ